MSRKQIVTILLAILIVGAAVRMVGLGKGDILTDEVFYGFRAIELVDFSEADTQTTPLEWFDPDIPFWTKYSFHDHPPIVFLLQHFSIEIFGETPFAIRLPSAVLGLLSVLLVYFIASQFFDKKAAFMGAAFLAVTAAHVYVSRLALQEATVIFFILLTLFLLIKAIDREKYFIHMGVALGFAFLTKFISFILLPIIATVLFFLRKENLFNKKLWLGVLLAVVLFTPVIYYNINLYQEVGHFDFQFSYLFGQDPDIWKVAPGKDIGPFSNRVKEFFPNLFSTNSMLFLITSLVSVAYAIYLFKKDSISERVRRGIMFGFISLVWVLLLLSFIGPSFRFLTLLAPIFTIFITVLFRSLVYKNKVYVYIFLLILLLELLFSINTFLIEEPFGKRNITYSQTRNDTFQWGYNELAEYLDNELLGKKPEVTLTMTYQFLNELHDRRLIEYEEKELDPYAAIILYDENIFGVPQLWYLERLNIYHAWPVMKIGSYLKVREQEPEFYKQFETVYVVVATERTLLRQDMTTSGKDFEKEVLSAGHTSTSIFNENGDEAFRVYSFIQEQ